MCGNPPQDPLSIRLSVSYQGLWWQVGGEHPDRWIITATAPAGAGETRRVGEISLAIADLTAGHDLFDAAALGDWAVEFLGDAVADPIHGTLVAELEEQISVGPPYLVVLRNITVSEAWRGHGLCAPLTAGALLLFARYTRLAVCRASPTGLAALEATGFRRWGDVHIIDVRSPALPDVRNRALDRWRQGNG